MSLRSTLLVVTAAVTLIAVIVAAALVTLTSALHRTTQTSSDALESVRLTEEAQIDLLLHERSVDPLVKRSVEGDLFRRLREVRKYVTMGEESRALAEAKLRVETYVVRAREQERPSAEFAKLHQDAYEAMERLVAVNTAQSREARREAERWDRLGNALGIAVGSLFVAFAAAVLVWLRERAFEPILRLAQTMKRFAAGDRDARAVERGPLEVREICNRFNEMAVSIAAQREAQAAILGGIAHDLRSPLAALSMSVTLLARGQRSQDEEHFRKTIERLRRQILRMDRMLGDFLDVSRIEAGMLELRVERPFRQPRPLRRRKRAATERHPAEARSHEFACSHSTIRGRRRPRTSTGRNARSTQSCTIRRSSGRRSESDGVSCPSDHRCPR